MEIAQRFLFLPLGKQTPRMPEGAEHDNASEIIGRDGRRAPLRAGEKPQRQRAAAGGSCFVGLLASEDQRVGGSPLSRSQHEHWQRSGSLPVTHLRHTIFSSLGS